MRRRRRGSPTPEPTPDLAREIRHWLIAEIHMPDPSPPRPPFATVPIYAMFCQVDGELTFVREEACPLLTGAFTLRVTPALEEAAPMDAQIPYCLQREDGGEYRVAIHGVCVLRTHILIDPTMLRIWEDAGWNDPNLTVDRVLSFAESHLHLEQAWPAGERLYRLE